MKKSLWVAKWEYLEKIKTKAFIISLFLTPAIIIAFSILPTMLATKENESTRAIGILDKTGEYFGELKNELESYKLKDNQQTYLVINLNSKNGFSETTKSDADNNVFKNKIDGYLLIDKIINDSVTIDYRTKSIGNFRDINRFEEAFNNIRIKKRLENESVSPELVSFLRQNIQINQIKIEQPGEKGTSDFESIFFSSFIFILLLMMMIIYSGQMLVRSLLEEKSNRLIEILISSCTPNDLLAGKVLGLSSLGLTQIFVWMIIGISLAGAAVVPLSTYENIPLILVYFILGFVFYTTLFVGIGSIVSTEQEAQQITSYLSILLVLPTVFILSALQNPESSFIKTLSYIPFTLPSVMILRVNINPVPLWEILTTILIMIVSILVLIKVSSKIFRIGILSYGKMPSLSELKSWLRED